MNDAATRRPRAAVPKAIAACFVAFVVAVTVVALTTGERALDRCARVLVEGEGVTVRGWSWRPFGIRCEVVTRAGTTRDLVVPPW
ncbi:MAG TPA: hypothetical protein VHJ34_09315 [Actinomycetota bacterium]|nr:hypothetical protein [Actinomycetota bacterium]